MDENEIRQLAEASAQALQSAMPTGGAPSVQPRSTLAETPEEGEGPGILGTIAGDDTIFITPTAETDMDELYDSVLELFEHAG